jgi:hypothetical protein
MDEQELRREHEELRSAGFVRVSRTEWVAAQHVQRVTISDQLTVHLLSGETATLEPEQVEAFGREMSRAFQHAHEITGVVSTG